MRIGLREPKELPSGRRKIIPFRQTQKYIVRISCTECVRWKILQMAALELHVEKEIAFQSERPKFPTC
jgi:hypothetical protein